MWNNREEILSESGGEKQSISRYILVNLPSYPYFFKNSVITKILTLCVEEKYGESKERHQEGDMLQ